MYAFTVLFLFLIQFIFIVMILLLMLIMCRAATNRKSYGVQCYTRVIIIFTFPLATVGETERGDDCCKHLLRLETLLGMRDRLMVCCVGRVLVLVSQHLPHDSGGRRYDGGRDHCLG